MQLDSGAVAEGRVTRVTDFGAFIQFENGETGLVHISQIAHSFVRNIHDHVREGENVEVKVLGRDDRGRLQVQAAVTAGRARIGAIAASHGFAALPSATNFVTLDCGRDGDFARRVLAQLAQRGVFVRMPGVAPLDRCIRVSVGPDAALDAFEAALGPALKAVPL